MICRRPAHSPDTHAHIHGVHESLHSFWKTIYSTSRRSYTRLDCVACKAVSKRAQTNLHARVHRGLLNKEVGLMPATNNCDFQYANMSVDLFAHHAAAEGSKWRMRAVIGRHDQVGCHERWLAASLFSRGWALVPCVRHAPHQGLGQDGEYQ